MPHPVTFPYSSSGQVEMPAMLVVPVAGGATPYNLDFGNGENVMPLPAANDSEFMYASVSP